MRLFVEQYYAKADCVIRCIVNADGSGRAVEANATP